jgi:hypothetical protein
MTPGGRQANPSRNAGRGGTRRRPDRDRDGDGDRDRRDRDRGGDRDRGRGGDGISRPVSRAMAPSPHEAEVGVGPPGGCAGSARSGPHWGGGGGRRAPSTRQSRQPQRAVTILSPGARFA